MGRQKFVRSSPHVNIGTIGHVDHGSVRDEVARKAGTGVGDAREARLSHTCPYLWRWRELNPRPTAPFQDFSGRSLLPSFSAPRSHADKLLDGLSHCSMSPPAPGPGRRVKPSH
jgi:hypothetical protein